MADGAVRLPPRGQWSELHSERKGKQSWRGHTDKSADGMTLNMIWACWNGVRGCFMTEVLVEGCLLVLSHTVRTPLLVPRKVGC